MNFGKLALMFILFTSVLITVNPTRSSILAVTKLSPNNNIIHFSITFLLITSSGFVAILYP